MTKKDFFEYAKGKRAIVTSKLGDRQTIIDNITKQVADHNKATNDNITIKNDGISLKISNGQFVMLPMKPIEGEFLIQSTNFAIGELWFEKKHCHNMTKEGFETDRSIIKIVN